MPLRQLGPACPGNPAHGPLTKDADGRWWCYSADQEGYSGFGKYAAANDDIKVPGREPTRHAWRRDELVWP